MVDIIYYIISTFLYYIILKQAFGIFFVKKDMSYFFSFVVWVLFMMLEILGTTLITIPIYRLIFETGSSFILCIILYEGSIRKKLIWVMVLNLLGMITEVLVGYIFAVRDFDNDILKIIGSFVSKILLLIIFLLLKLTEYTRLKRDISIKNWIILFSIPVGSILVLNTIYRLCIKIEDKKMFLMSLLSSAFILVINLFVFYIYESMSEKIELKKQQMIIDKQLELCRNQINQKEKSDIHIKNLKHDIENHLICIREYLERKNEKNAIIYIDNLLDDGFKISDKMGINTGNIVVDALINYKNMIAERKKIKIISHVEIPTNLGIADVDICAIIGNCLDNAIEAVEQIEDEEDKKIWIELFYRKNNIFFKIKNQYVNKILKDRFGNIVTTKKDTEKHGLGLISVKKTVQKYNGYYEINTNDNFFEVSVLIYCKR